MFNIYLPLLLIAITICRDQTNPTGFVKKLFDFSYPPEGIYPISLSNTTITTGGNGNQNNNFIRAYGDFNNDLRADYVAFDANFNTLVFIYSTSSNLYELSQNISAYQGCNPISYYLCTHPTTKMMPMMMVSLILLSGAPIPTTACIFYSRTTPYLYLQHLPLTLRPSQLIPHSSNITCRQEEVPLKQSAY